MPTIAIEIAELKVLNGNEIIPEPLVKRFADKEVATLAQIRRAEGFVSVMNA